MAAPALDVDKEAVRVLVVAVGPREAARRMGLNENTVRQWSARGAWLAHAKPENQPALPTSMQKTIVTNVTKPADALADALADDSKQTRLSLSRSARRLAQQAESAPLEQAGDALQVGKLAQLVHGWAGPGGTTSQAMVVNISVLGAAPDHGPIVDLE